MIKREELGGREGITYNYQLLSIGHSRLPDVNCVVEISFNWINVINKFDYDSRTFFNYGRNYVKWWIT